MVSAFEKSSADLARPYAQRMGALHPSPSMALHPAEANAKRAPSSSDLAALREVDAIRAEAMRAGVLRVRLGLGLGFGFGLGLGLGLGYG